jgi:alkaline phosphatase D
MRYLSLLCLLLARTGAAQVGISGPMPGHSDHLATSVWLQCHGPCAVQLEYWNADSARSVRRRTPVQQGDPRNAYAMTFVLDGLVPCQRYAYRVLVGGKELAMDDSLFVSTQCLWKWRTEPPDFSLVTGSCAYINEPAYDRPGRAYGGDYGIFGHMADERADLMLWLGDNTYLREPDWGTRSGYLHRYTHTRRTPELQRLLRSTHHYAIWDDHDFGPNDADGAFAMAPIAREAFDLFWPNPEGRPTGLRTITTAFSYNDVDFFLLDNRTERVPGNMVTTTPTILGAAQIDWLIRALKSSQATFKVVAVGGQFLNDAAVFENYATVPQERQAILDRIDAEGIRNVIFLTGDRHFSELSHLVLPSGLSVYDLTVSPLTSGAYATPQETNNLQVLGTRVTERNYGVLRFTGPRKERKLTMAIHASDGRLLWERTIQAQE